MLTQLQIENLLFSDHKYFDCEENYSQYTQEELKTILMHLEKLAEKYFNRVMELHNDPYERADKNTARNVMNNAYNQIYNHYLNKINTTQQQVTIRSNISYYIIGAIIIIIIYVIILIILSILWCVMN
jgi:hypothetical protein